MWPYLNNLVLMEALDEYVTGHEAAKKALIVMLNRSKIRCYQKYTKYMADEFLVSPLKLLLLGASGTGKTHLVKTLSNICSVPIVVIDATDLNPTGASGGVKTDKIQKMILDKAREMAEILPNTYPYLEYAIDSTIVYVDEIDKLGTAFESSGNWNKHVQSNFLTMFDNKDDFAGVSFVFSGAFDSITREKIVQKKELGFTPAADVVEKELLDEQILKAGLIPELLGRINMIVELDRFTVDDFVSIINTRILPKKKMDLAAYGSFNIELSSDTIHEIALKSVKSGQGIRYAQREIDRYFLDQEYNAGLLDLSENFYLLEGDSE